MISRALAVATLVQLGILFLEVSLELLVQLILVIALLDVLAKVDDRICHWLLSSFGLLLCWARIARWCSFILFGRLLVVVLRHIQT